jgi:cytochrome c553
VRVATRRRWKRIGGVVLAGVAAIVLAGFLFAWSGLYNVAASRGHLALTNAALTFGMQNSVRTHALGIKVPSLDNEDLSTLGAAHFHSGCAFCHGAPGVPISPIAQSMLPSPPNLKTSMREWRDRELFWIVKNGLKYTGMPAWAAQQRDDEVWALVAFLRRLPALDADAYRELALGGLSVPAQSGSEIATSEGSSEAVSACARCHGAGPRGPASRLVPVLHGQPAAFLMAALEDYAHARRPSGIMQPLASDLSDEGRKQVSRYYAGLAPPVVSKPALNAESVDRGRRLATGGDPGARIPACMDCHNASALEVYPRLAGQHAPYLANRLRLWKAGLTAPSRTDPIMAPIARSLSDRQIEDVSAYFSTMRPDGKPNR